MSRTRLNRIWNAADPIFDPASPQFIGTTVAYNPFGDFREPIPSNAAGISFATVHSKDIQISKLTAADFTLYTTSLFTVPAGGVGFAMGGQFRREVIRQDPDQLLTEGDIAGFGGPATTTDAGRKSFGIYSEATVPIFSAANSITGFHALELTGSARFEDYLDNNTNMLVPKVGLRWQRWDETFTVRSTWGEGFREPSLFELHVSPQTFFRALVDPVTGNFDSETPIVLKSNPDLQPEDSRNFTAGIVYSPRFVPGLTITADLFDIERQDVVRAPDPAAVLQREAQAKLLPGEEVLRDASGAITEIIAPYENNGGETARGIDFGLQYQLQTSFGTFTSQSDATWLESFRLANAARAPALEVRSQGAATGVGSDDAYLKWKGRSRLSWSWNRFDLNATVTYTDGFHEILFHDPSLPDGKKEHWVHQTWFVDAQASYHFAFAAPIEAPQIAGYSKTGTESAHEIASLPCWKRVLDNTTLTIGCNNIFGQDPPKAFFSNAGYADFIYDSVGRFVYISLKKQF